MAEQHPRRQQTSSDGTSKSGGTSSSRRTNSDETPGTSIVSQSPMDLDSVLPHLEAPGEFERAAYYWAFPSRPKLLGRTSAGTTPWWRLTEPPIDEEAYYGETGNLNNATRFGPVGRHAIHACWETTTRRNIVDVLGASGDFPWTSIDVLRIGRKETPEAERPVIVWVGVQTATETAPEPSWPAIARKLRLIRKVLDTDGLRDVECEMRTSVTFTTAGAGPRLLLPPRSEERRRKTAEELLAAQAISTAVGTSISPGHQPTTSGTLGLYLAPATTSPRVPGRTVWGLTCRHVVFPASGDKTAPPAPVLLPSIKALTMALEFVNQVLRDEQELAGSHRETHHTTPETRMDMARNQSTLSRAQTLRHTLLSFQASDAARVVGQVSHSPPTGVNDVPGEIAFTRDWALVALDREKFPPNFDFGNVVDLDIGSNAVAFRMAINDRIRGAGARGVPKPEYSFPRDRLQRLQGVVPRREFQGAQLAHNLSVLNEDQDPCLVLMKRGLTTGLTAGIALDIRSVRRVYDGGMAATASELAIVHIKGKAISRGQPNLFSDGGDSGSVIFDLKGRIAGMLTAGSSQFSSGGIDISYATPIEDLLRDIERTVGVPVRIL